MGRVETIDKGNHNDQHTSMAFLDYVWTLWVHDWRNFCQVGAWMKITPVKHGLEDLIGKSTMVRGEGLHVSTIYNDLYQDLEPTRYRRGTVPDPLRLEAGLAFESFLEDALRQRLLPGERPSEFTHHEPGIDTPIFFNPDLILFNGITRIGEIKLTWLSTRDAPREPANAFPPKWSKYTCQMMAYCHMLETPYAKLIGYFVNGPYTDMAPELLAWEVDFTARELQDNWDTLISQARLKRMI